MGWLFSQSWPTKSALIKHLLSQINEPIAHAVRGECLWVVAKERAASRKLILCILMHSQKDFGWGYKDMDESMGLYFFHCPLRFLDLVDEPLNDSSREWREQVRAYHAKKNRKLEVGEVYSLVGTKNPKMVRIVNLKPLRGRCPEGFVYRIPRRMLGEKLAEKAYHELC